MEMQIVRKFLIFNVFNEESYGIHVAQIAGIPKKVILNAQKILEEIEKKI